MSHFVRNDGVDDFLSFGEKLGGIFHFVPNDSVNFSNNSQALGYFSVKSYNIS